MAFKGGVVLGTVNFNATGSGTTSIGATSNTGTISIGNTSSGAVSIDCGTSGITLGTTANAHSTTLGSTNSTSATTVQSGSGALNITSTNGAITINSGTGTVAIGNDATAATYNFATGAGAKTVTLGTTNTTSSLALKYGTSDFTLASATGTVMSALDTGEITYPLQPAFLAYNTGDDTNQTGNGAAATVQFNTEIFDQNGDFASNTFTAPVTGRYQFTTIVTLINLASTATSCYISLQTSNRNYFSQQGAIGVVRNSSDQYGVRLASMADMDSGDTATIVVSVSGMAGNTVTIQGVVGSSQVTWFGGSLLC